MSNGVKMIQMGLQEEGFSPGIIDGIDGPKTRAAAVAWGRRTDPPARPTTAAAKAAPGPMIYQGSQRFPVREIVLHCSDTRPSWMAKEGLEAQIAEIRRWHMQDRGWHDIGYHWITGRDGRYLPGRPVTRVGAGVEGHNEGVIHCCLIGGHGAAKTDPFLRHFTLEQDVAMRRLIAMLSTQTEITRISGHNNYAAKACPGFDVAQWLMKGA